MLDDAKDTLNRVEPNIANDMIALMRDMLRWQKHIERAVRNLDDLYTFNDIVSSVLRQERFFYEFGDCCLIMQISETPQAKLFHCFIACGTTEAILRAEPEIAKVGKQLGCKYLSFSGRPGWPRRLKGSGWRHVLSVMHKEIP